MSYADTGMDSELSFMESAQDIALFKGIGVFAILVALAILIVTSQRIDSIRSTTVGALLTIYGLLMLGVWDVNYIVIGMGLIALSGTFLVFKNGIGKLIYIIAILFLSIFASIEHGAGSRDFFFNVGFLYVIGAGIFLFVPDESFNEALSYESDEPIDNKQSAKQQLINQKILHKYENTQSIDSDTAKVLVTRIALVLLLIAVLMIAYSAYG